jgi:hypothetical protein
MQQAAILRPFVAMMLLTLGVWIYMFARRLPFLSRNKLTRRQLSPLEIAQLSPPAVATPADNLRNLFELPVIFYAVVLYLYATRSVDQTYLAAAWVFFGFRVLHSTVHCTFNHVPLRFLMYLIASIALWFMVFRVALGVFG